MVIVLGFPGILIQEWTTTGRRTLGISVTAMIEQLSLGSLPPPVSARPCPNSLQTQSWVRPRNSVPLHCQARDQIPSRGSYPQSRRLRAIPLRNSVPLHCHAKYQSPSRGSHPRSRRLRAIPPNHAAAAGQTHPSATPSTRSADAC
jgi:hypothetical protein